MIGYCTICNVYSIQTAYAPVQCACNQLFQSFECKQNPNCFWNGTNCYNASCSSIQTQYFCSTNPRCAWSDYDEICQPFTQCSDLTGVNAAECLSNSVNCAAVTTTRSHNNKFICSSPQNQCVSTSSHECENTFFQGGVCQWQSYAYKPSCQKITSCNQLSKKYCQLLWRNCSWSANYCTQITSCNQLSDCSYYFSELGNLSNSIVFCYLNSQQSCVSQQKSTLIAPQLKEQNCYSNTFQMYRWTSQGYCLSCSLNIQTPQLCKCSQLSQSECGNNQKCQFSNNTCIDKTCNDYTLQQPCLQANCMWVAGQCQSFTNCEALLHPSSQIDCEIFSFQCPVYNQQTKTCQQLQKCNEQQTQYNCNTINQQITIPYCYWNQQTQICQTINNCGQINDIYECNLQYNRCKWINKCIPQECNSFTSQTNCNYIYTSYIPGDITICQWDSIMNICRNAPLNTISTFTNDTCSNNTGYNYHYDGNQCVRCQEVILFTLVILIQLLQ